MPSLRGNRRASWGYREVRTRRETEVTDARQAGASQLSRPSRATARALAIDQALRMRPALGPYRASRSVTEYTSPFPLLVLPVSRSSLQARYPRRARGRCG